MWTIGQNKTHKQKNCIGKIISQKIIKITEKFRYKASPFMEKKAVVLLRNIKSGASRREEKNPLIQSSYL
ncbi:hypothetical protein CYANOKiyG1_43220 [Okeania sp. KiyG1]|nr:hypothetical protein CYANOKiyG1_43220 [Okeania sp. KiyG1]